MFRVLNYCMPAALVVAISTAGLLAGCSRERPAPSQPPSRGLVFLEEWGTTGEGPGQFKEPSSTAIDTAGLVYVADAGNGYVHVFDRQGQFLRSFPGQRLGRPTGVAVDQNGAVYVADYLADTIFVFSRDGSKLREVHGSPSRPFQGPIGVAVDGASSLFVVEFDGHRIQKFDSRGRFVKAWGKDGGGPREFHYPIDLAVGPDGNLYVADTHNRRVQKFSRDGELLAAWGKPGTAPDMMHDITGISVSDRFVFLTDSGNHRVQVWTLDGRHVHTDDGGGRFRSALQTPTDVAVGPRGDLFVLNPFAKVGPRVVRLRLNLELPVLEEKR